MLTTNPDDALTSGSGIRIRAGELVATTSPQPWPRLPVETRADVPRTYRWRRVPLSTGWPTCSGRRLLARRPINTPDVACGSTPNPAARSNLVRRVSPARRGMHSTSQEQRCYRPRPSALPAILVRPHPVRTRARIARCLGTISDTSDFGGSEPGAITYTLAALHRRSIHLVARTPHLAEHLWSWSRSRRRHHRVAPCHCRHREHPPACRCSIWPCSCRGLAVLPIVER